MKRLNELLDCDYDTLIKDIKIDSREIEDGDLFVAVNGFNCKHSDFIPQAIENGASAVICDIDYEADIPIIKVSNVNEVLNEVCIKFYEYSNGQTLIGITGTDGKTSTATMLSALLHKRVDDFKFKYSIFTNITEDHLNIHKTIENYINSKLKLAELTSEDGAIIINNDDENCKRLLERGYKNLYTYGKSEDSNFKIENIKEMANSTEFDISYNDSTYHIVSPYVGSYNVYNLTAAFIVCFLEKITVTDIIKEITELTVIKGRTESLDFGQKYKLILDYAHTLNGIKNIVESFKGKYKRIILLTGSAGGREHEKRSKIGSYILHNADLVVFTMDDPRYESVDEIIDQMIGNEKCRNYVRINDRKEAIKYALDTADTDDLVLILGKGRDNYMAIEDKREKYCDYDVIKDYFKKK